MANPYIPTNLKIEEYLEGSILVSWECSAIITSLSASRYKIYVKKDSADTYTVYSVVNRLSATIPIEYSIIAISSVHPTLGESSKSQPLVLKSPESMSDSNSLMSVAVDKKGNARALLVDENGKLITSADVDVEISGISTEAKQDIIIDKLDEVKIAVENTMTFRETEVSSVTPSGTIIEFDWENLIPLCQITVILKTGAATGFIIEILSTATPVDETQVLSRMESTESRFDMLGIVPFKNASGEDKLYVRIIPNIGTSNTFFVRIAGR